MRKALIALAVIALLLAAVLVGAIYAVKPQHDLNLVHEPISITEKVTAIILNRKLEVVLSEQDITNLAKKQIAEQPDASPQFHLTGIDLQLNGAKLFAEVNGRWRNRLNIGAVALYTLAWTNGTIVATPTDVSVKRLDLSSKQLGLEPIVIPINDGLPPFVKIDRVGFEEAGIRFHLALKQ